MTQKQTITCERCGMEVYHQHKSKHQKRCATLPTPVELARMLLDDDSLTVTRMAKNIQGYVSRSFTERVNIGLAQLGYPSATALTIAKKDTPSADISGETACPRCGLPFARIDLHKRRCEALPLPLELAKEFLDGKLQLVDLSQKYANNTGSVAVRERLRRGLQLMGIEEQPLALSLKHRQDAVEAEEARLAEIRANMVRCKVCGIDMNVAPAGKDGACGWCLEPALELSRVGDAPYQKFEVSGTLVLLLDKRNGRKKLLPFVDVVTAVDKQMAQRGANMRAIAQYGDKWQWGDPPNVTNVTNASGL